MGLESPRINSTISGTTQATVINADDLEVDSGTLSVDADNNRVGVGTTSPGVQLEVQDTTTGSANTGGALRLSADDGAAMGDSHRLGVIEFTGAEDGSNTQVVGARIEAITDAAWTNIENGCALYFYTTDGNASQTNVLKLDSNAKATFAGAMQAEGLLTCTGETNGEYTALVLKNEDATADNSGSVTVRFDLEDTSGAAVDSGSIRVKKLESMTNTAGTQNAKMDFYLTEDGTITRQGSFLGSNEFSFGKRNSTIGIDAVGGTDSNGKDFTFKSGAGTGVGDPGNLLFQVPIPGVSGSSVQSFVPAVSMTPEGMNTYWGGTAALGNDTGVGDIVTFGAEDTSDTLAAGRLMYLHTDGKWMYADADAVATGGTQLLGIALGASVSDGLLIRGFFKLNSYTEGTWNEGLPCYVSEATGEIDFTAPSASGDFVRVVGYGTDTSGVIFFNPSATNIVIA